MKLNYAMHDMQENGEMKCTWIGMNMNLNLYVCRCKHYANIDNEELSNWKMWCKIGMRMCCCRPNKASNTRSHMVALIPMIAHRTRLTYALECTTRIKQS